MSDRPPLIPVAVNLVMCTNCQSVRVMVPNETKVGVWAGSAADKLAGNTINLYTCNRCNAPMMFKKVKFLFDAFFVEDYV